MTPQLTRYKSRFPCAFGYITAVRDPSGRRDCAERLFVPRISSMHFLVPGLFSVIFPENKKPSRGSFFLLSFRKNPARATHELIKVVLATFLSAMAAIAAIQSSGRERPLPSTQPSPHTVAHCARLRICVSNPRWTGEVVRLATIA